MLNKGRKPCQLELHHSLISVSPGAVVVLVVVVFFWGEGQCRHNQVILAILPPVSASLRHGRGGGRGAGQVYSLPVLLARLR